MTQPEALRLADALEDECGLDGYSIAYQAAIKLRRLHEELDRCKATCAATAEAWREESEQMADAHLKQGLTIAELFEQRDALLEALKFAEAALSDIGDADREPGDDVAWCEARAAEAIPQARAAIAKAEGEKT